MSAQRLSALFPFCKLCSIANLIFKCRACLKIETFENKDVIETFENQSFVKKKNPDLSLFVSVATRSRRWQ